MHHSDSFANEILIDVVFVVYCDQYSVFVVYVQPMIMDIILVIKYTKIREPVYSKAICQRLILYKYYVV